MKTKKMKPKRRSRWKGIVAVIAALLCIRSCGSKPAKKHEAPAPDLSQVELEPEVSSAPVEETIDASYYYGTWTLTMLSDGTDTYAVEDLIDLGADPAELEIYFIIQEGGQCQVVEPSGTAIGEWEATETGISCGGGNFTLQDEYLTFSSSDGSRLMFLEKTSSSQEFVEKPAAAEAAQSEESEKPEEPEPEPEPAKPTGIRPEFKEAMDSYEAFYDEYCSFMKEYSNNPTDLSLLTKYTDMLSKAAEMDEKFEAWDEDEMSDEELSYYLDVTLRIEKKLLDLY